jgi:hypothetical protein
MPVRYGSLPFTEAIQFFRQKLDMPTQRWDEIWRDAHNRAFIVAGATKTDLLADLRGAVDKAISEGKSLGWFKREFKTLVTRHGWEHTGTASWRSRLIYETNLRQSYNAGREEQIQRIKHKRPFALYRHGDSAHPRELHLKWNNLVLPVDDPWWETHTPSNGFGCHCKKFLLSEADLQRRGLTVGTAPEDGHYEWLDKATGEIQQIPRGIDPGFDYRPAKPEQVTQQVKKQRATRKKLAERLPQRIVDSAYSTAKQINAQTLSDLLAQLPTEQREPLSRFLAKHPTKTLFIKQTEMSVGKGSLKVASQIAEYLGKEAASVRNYYCHRRPKGVNGFTSKNWDHLVVRVKASDSFKGVDIQSVQQAARQVVRAAKENSGPRSIYPRGISGEQLKRYWSVSANVGEQVGESAQRLSTWLHELGHQIHYYAGVPDISQFGAVSQYGMTNKLECFAEWFAAWAFARDEVLLFNPALAARIEAIIAEAIQSEGKSG